MAVVSIEELRISGFGGLRGTEHRFASDRLNIVIAPNETGKSSLAHAIFALFYGVDTHGRKTTNSPLPRALSWRPWGGPPFGVQGRIAVGEKHINLSWDFERKRPVLTMRDSRTGADVGCDRYDGADGNVVGRNILGLTPSEFAATCFIGHRTLADIETAETLTAHLEQITDTESGDGTVQQALATLRESTTKYQGERVKSGHITTEIGRLESDLKKTAEALRLVEHEWETLSLERQEHKVRLSEIRGLEQNIERTRKSHDSAWLIEMDQRVSELEAAKNSLDELEQRRNSLKDSGIELFPAHGAGRLSELTTTIGALGDQLGEHESRLGSLQSDFDSIIAEQGALGPVSLASKDDHDFVRELISQAGGVEEALRSAISRKEEIASLFDEAGASFTDLERRWAALSELPTHSQQRLRAYPQELAALNGKSQAAQIAMDSDLAKLDDLDIRTRKSLIVGSAIAFAAVAVAAGVGLAVVRWSVAVAIALIGAAAGAATAVLGRARLRSELDNLRDDIRFHEREKEEHAASVEALEKSVSDDVSGDQFESLDRGLEALEATAPFTTDLTRLDEVRREMQANGERLSVQRNDAQKRLDRFEIQIDETRQVSVELDRASVQIGRAIKLTERLRDITRSREFVETESRKAQKARRDQEVETREILKSGSIDFEDIADGVTRFQKRAEEYREYREVVERIPEALARVNRAGMPDELLIERQRRKSLAADYQTDISVPGKPSAALQDELDDLQAQLISARQVLAEVEHNLHAGRQKYHQQAPKLQAEYGLCADLLERTRARLNAANLALEVLEELSEKSHRQWASELNERMEDAVGHLNPTVGRVVFDEALHATVTLKDGHVVPHDRLEMDLSAGAIDQVYLAMRLAIADSLSAGGAAAPVVLDDPLVNCDDQRAETAVRWLAESVASKRQVILLSCHDERIQNLMLRDPSWAGEHLVITGLDALESENPQPSLPF